MNDTLKAILDRILSLSKDQLLAMASGSGTDTEISELTGLLANLKMAELEELLNASAKGWDIDVSSLSGGSGAAEEVEEEDTSKLYEIIIKGLKESSKKISGTLFLKNVIKNDPSWTLSFVKSGVDNLVTKPFIVPVAYQKSDPELTTKLNEITGAGFDAEIKAKD